MSEEIQFRSLNACDPDFEQKRKQWIAEIEQEEKDFRNRLKPDELDHDALNNFFRGPDDDGQWHPWPASKFHSFSRCDYNFTEEFGRMHRLADNFNRIRLQARFGQSVMELVGWQEVHGVSDDVFRRLAGLVVLGYSTEVVLAFAEECIDPEDYYWTEPTKKRRTGRDIL
jgi:hypothetical protein